MISITNTSRENNYCMYCSYAFEKDAPYPRICRQCQHITYSNPLAVAVLLQPVDNGLLVIRRAMNPRIGSLALPGGFIDVGESWQIAGTRELYEEANVTIDAKAVKLYDTLSAPDGTVLIFGIAPPLTLSELPPFLPNDEVSERTIITELTELAFPLHTQVANTYLKSLDCYES